ncbi:MAG: very short patch repair endonuclease, partial [Stackebrandtia sp.]
HTKAKRNASYWSEKVERNRRRDLEVNKALDEAGWTVIRVWEHEDVAAAAQLVAGTVRKLRG